MTTIVQPTSRIAEYISIKPSSQKRYRATFFELAR
jgi:hypothetical protein